MELEKYASKYIVEALEYEKKGDVQRAIAKYKEAIEILRKLYDLYTHASISHVYAEQIKFCKSKIDKLSQGQGAHAKSPVATYSPNIKWEDIADLSQAKKAIREAIVYPSKRPDLFPLGFPKGILLFGPPGCGKTLLGAAVVAEIDAKFFYVDAASIMSKWLGESEKNVKTLFERARSCAKNGRPAIIFVDECDALFGIRREEIGGEVRVRNQFLKEMDGISEKKEHLPVFVIGATNKPWLLDGAFLRRFQKRIYIPLPDYLARIEIFKLYLSELKVSDDVSVEDLARLTEGFSSSDIRDIVQMAYLRTVRELFEQNLTGQPRPLMMSDFFEVLKERKPSVSRKTLVMYEKWAEDYKAL